MAVLLGLIVAATYGTADFLGGSATKRSPVAAVVVGSQLFALPVTVLLVLLSGGDPTRRVLLLGCAAGAIGGIGLLCLYRGLAGGRMSVVAPVTAVGAAIVPVGWGLVHGERPSPVSLAGVGLALVAVVLISQSHFGEADSVTPPKGLPVLALAVVAGAAFGTVFVLLAETGSDAGFWPLVAGRVTSVVFLAAGALATGRSVRPAAGRDLVLIAATGTFDITANAVYLLAARRGLLALVAVLSSLYPAATVLLARVILHERLTRPQVAGLAMATTGVVLIAAG